MNTLIQNLDLKKVELSVIAVKNQSEKVAALLFLSQTLNKKIGPRVLEATLNNINILEYPYVRANNTDDYITATSNVLYLRNRKIFNSIPDLIKGCQKDIEDTIYNFDGTSDYKLKFDPTEQSITIGYTKFPVTIISKLQNLVN